MHAEFGSPRCSVFRFEYKLLCLNLYGMLKYLSALGLNDINYFFLSKLYSEVSSDMLKSFAELLSFPQSSLAQQSKVLKCRVS